MDADYGNDVVKGKKKYFVDIYVDNKLLKSITTPNKIINEELARRINASDGTIFGKRKSKEGRENNQ